jgi:hypothetical protein
VKRGVDTVSVMLRLFKDVAKLGAMVAIVLPLFGQPVAAQPPAAQPPASADTPNIRVGVTIFADYSVQTEPEGTDVDGNTFTPNAFNIGRAYVNVTGNISRIVAFRVTPDIVRESGSGSSNAGSYVYRLKYAYAQFTLDDWVGRGAYARFGMQPTPWIDFIDSVYRYRFQGPTLEDREGILSSSDVGATFRYNFKNNYGDVHTGFYNGDNYNRAEPNDQKAWMTRATVRPLPMHEMLRGLRITGFYNLDAYVKDGEKRRGIVGATYEHPYVNVGFNYLSTTDQARGASPSLDGDGFSVWATPKTPKGYGWEGLLRFDHLEQEQATASTRGERNRTIAGVAYWFPRQGTVSSALLFDYEQVDNDNYAPVRADERRWTLHALINF